MKCLVAILAAAVTLSAAPASACSSGELQQKQKAFSEGVKAAFQRDPGGDAARRAKVQEITVRYYTSLKNVTHGGSIIDALCKENDELLAVYK